MIEHFSVGVIGQTGLRGYFRQGLNLILVLLLGLATSTLALATDIGDREQEALSRIADHLDDPSRADELLAQVHFPPPGFAEGPAEHYQHWPVLRKLEAAYSGAVTAGGKNAGDDFLKAFARVIAVQQSNAIRHEASLRSYFPEPHHAELVLDVPDLRYDVQKAIKSQPASPKLQSILMTLDKYAGRLPGGVQSLMANCCKLPQARIYEILSTSEDYHHALLRTATESGVPPPLQEKIRRMLTHVSEHTNALRHEAIFDDFLRPRGASGFQESTAWKSDLDSPLVDTNTAAKREQAFHEAVATLASEAAKEHDATYTPGPWAGGGGGGSPATLNAERYRAVSNTVYGVRPSAPGRASFRTLARGRGGFGGIVMGNTIVAPKLAKPQQIMWVKDTNTEPVVGHFEFVFADGKTGFSAEYPQYMVAAANALANSEPSEPKARASADEIAVGLAGLDTGTSDVMIPIFADQGIDQISAKRFVVHPLLDGTPVGYAAVATDALSFMSGEDWFVDRLRQSGVPDAMILKAVDWLTAKRGFFKITDVPIQITRRADGMLVVARVTTPPFSASHRQAALLTMQSFTDNTPDPEFKTPFYAIVPSLSRSFDDFALLNQFAGAFALVRYANINGARWSGIRPALQLGPSKTWAINGKDGSVRLISLDDIPTAILRFIDDIEAHSKQLASSPAVPETLAKVLAELSEHRVRMVQSAFAARDLVATQQGESTARAHANAIRSLLDKANAEYKEQVALLKTMEATDCGLAPKEPLESYIQAAKQVEMSRDTIKKQKEELADLQSLDHRLELASEDVRAKYARIEQQAADLLVKFVTGQNLSEREKEKLLEQMKKLKQSAEKLLPQPIAQIEKLRRSMDVAAESGIKAMETEQQLLEGPLKRWATLINFQAKATNALQKAVVALLPLGTLVDSLLADALSDRETGDLSGSNHFHERTDERRSGQENRP